MSAETSTLHGSAGLIINPYSDNAARRTPAQIKRAEALEARRLGAPTMTKVDKVSSITVDLDAIIMGSHSFTSGATTTQYVSLLIINPTSAYSGSEDIFHPRHGAGGEIIQPDVFIKKAEEVLSIPVGTSKSLEEARQKWKERNVIVGECPSHYTLTSCCLIGAKIATSSAVEMPIHSGFRVTLSAFGYLFEPDDVKRGANAGNPSAPGIILRAHVMKQTSPTNSPLLFKIFVENPRLMKLPIPTFDEIKKIDTMLKNTSKNADKPSYVGSMTLAIPMFCQNEDLETHITLLDKGTLARIGFQQSANSAFVFKKKDGSEVQAADVILSLDQWVGEEFSNDAVLFRLWSEGLKLFGVTPVPIWLLGIGEAMMKQTPTIFTGVVNHTDSEAYTRANTNDNIRSIMSLNAFHPIMDVPNAIMNYFGIPVSKEFAKEMCVCRMRPHNPKDATAHPLFTFVDKSLFKENFYNVQSNPVMMVLNELEYNARPYVFDGSVDWQFFAVVANKIMMDADKMLLKKLRVLRDTPTYTGPLGEMLTYKNWNCNDAQKWKDLVYGKAADGSHTKVPADHPVMQGNCISMANNEHFYIFAISPSRYSAAISKKTVSNAQKRLRDASTSNNNNDDDNDDNNNGNTADNGENEDAKFRRFDE